MAQETKSANDAVSKAVPFSHIKLVANRVLAENKALKRNLEQSENSYDELYVDVVHAEKKLKFLKVY